MADLDDEPEQLPLEQAEIERTIKALIPANHYDLVISHSPAGEYTRHRRHEEIGEAVTHLWHDGQIDAAELWNFAYEDGGGRYLPRAIAASDLHFVLTNNTWQKKYELITTEYNFSKDSWEARATPVAEAFWRFTNSGNAIKDLTDE
jgi:hypothetical protein